jgi:CubicO group peptidase (beta-lactamase class C family)
MKRCGARGGVSLAGSMISAKTAILFGLLSTSALAESPPNYAADFDHIFAKWSDSTPGCAVGVNKAGHLEFSKAYGSADLEHRIPNSLDTVFEAGSVAKQFTAMAILMLAREGKLSLDDPARKYIPEMPDYGKSVTIRAMLTHTSGLRDWGDIATIEGWPRTTRVYEDSDILNIVSRQKELNFAPGTRWSYSNTGYNLSEIIVSRVSGMSLADFTRQRIFLPLGMTHSAWRDDFTRIVPNRAIAYSRKGDEFHADMPFEDTYGHAGLLTTVGDLLKWNEHLASPDTSDSELVESQQRNYRLNNGRPTEYGYGLFVHEFKGAPEISHTGSTAGYASFVARYPSLSLSIVMLCNAAEVNTWEYGHAIADIWIPDPAKHQAADAKAFHLSAAQTNRLVGTYRDVLTGKATKISSESGKIRFGANAVMSPISPTRFQMDGKTGEVDERGTLTLTDTYGIVDQFERVAPMNPSSLQPADLAGTYVSPEIAGEVTVLASGTSVTLRFGTKTTLNLEPAYDNAFSDDRVTARFSGNENGKSTVLIIPSDRVWNLHLTRMSR